MCFRLFDLYRIQHRLMHLLNGVVNSKQCILQGHWEQITTPLIITDPGKIYFGRIPYEYGGSSTMFESFMIGGKNLQGDIEITCPSNLEVSNNNGRDWYSFFKLSLDSSSDTEITPIQLWIRFTNLSIGKNTVYLAIFTKDNPRIYLPVYARVYGTVPNISLVSAVSKTNNSATYEITVDHAGGEAALLSKGICWATHSNPTLDDNYTDEGTVIDTFQTTCTGLILGQTYYARAYAKNNTGVFYGSNIKFGAVGVIGDSILGGKLAYILQSGDPGYDADVQHGIIAAASDQVYQSPWITWDAGTRVVTEATGHGIGDGLINTNKIVAAQGAGTYAAKLCYDLSLNGYDDWVLPSIGELEKLYDNKAAIGGFTNVSAQYWSSTEAEAGDIPKTPLNNAHWALFNPWYVYLDIKWTSLNQHVRAIRYF